LPPETVKLTDTVFVAFAMRVMAEPLFMARAERARGPAATVNLLVPVSPEARSSEMKVAALMARITIHNTKPSADEWNRGGITNDYT
jgi:hypothetical protein